MFPLSQQVCGAGRQEDASRSCVGFGFPDLGAATLANGNGAADMKPPRSGIKILPPQTADLTSAHSRGQLRIKEVVPVWVLPDDRHEPLQLLLRQDLFRCVICLGNHRSIGGIFHNDPFLNCRIKCLMQHHMQVTDGAVREAAALFIVVIDPPKFPDAVVHFLHVGGGHRADFHIPQPGFDVEFDIAVVSPQGAFPEGQHHPFV